MNAISTGVRRVPIGTRITPVLAAAKNASMNSTRCAPAARRDRQGRSRRARATRPPSARTIVEIAVRVARPVGHHARAVLSGVSLRARRRRPRESRPAPGAIPPLAARPPRHSSAPASAAASSARRKASTRTSTDTPARYVAASRNRDESGSRELRHHAPCVGQREQPVGFTPDEIDGRPDLAELPVEHVLVHVPRSLREACQRTRPGLPDHVIEHECRTRLRLRSATASISAAASSRVFGVRLRSGVRASARLHEHSRARDRDARERRAGPPTPWSEFPEMMAGSWGPCLHHSFEAREAPGDRDGPSAAVSRGRQRWMTTDTEA